MGIGIRSGNRYWEVGTGDFLHAFFSTISFHLEPEGWGTRFPVLMNDLYQGMLSSTQAEAAISELHTAREGLARIPPSQVIWDIDNRSAIPPWGDNISPNITSLANYFVTSDGRDLLEVLLEALANLRAHGGDLNLA